MKNLSKRVPKFFVKTYANGIVGHINERLRRGEAPAGRGVRVIPVPANILTVRGRFRMVEIVPLLG